MSVDVFGRQWIREKEVHRGPVGIGFTLTTSGDFDIENILLCNVAEAQSDLDAVNLKLLNKLFHDLRLDIVKTMTGFGDRLKEKIMTSIKEDIKISLKGELDTEIKENTSNIEHIKCMMTNGSDNCEKPVYSR